MKILRQTETELVVQDSSIWMGVLLAACAFLPLYIAISQHEHRLFLAFGCLTLFAIPWIRRSTFTFDAATQSIRWARLRYLWTRTGSLSFSDVQSVDMQSTLSGQANVTIYRLALVIAQGPVPMSDVYSSGENQFTSVRDAIQRFLRIDPNSATPSLATGLDISIRALLQQGRKLDAIQLLRNTEKLSLTAATQRIDAIDASMKPALQ